MEAVQSESDSGEEREEEQEEDTEEVKDAMKEVPAQDKPRYSTCIVGL